MGKNLIKQPKTNDRNPWRMMVNDIGKSSLFLAARFRLVNYSNLPRFMKHWWFRRPCSPIGNLNLLRMAVKSYKPPWDNLPFSVQDFSQIHRHRYRLVSHPEISTVASIVCYLKRAAKKTCSSSPFGVTTGSAVWFLSGIIYEPAKKLSKKNLENKARIREVVPRKPNISG